jgi:hypothetical protein
MRTLWQVLLDQRITESPNETSFIVLHYISVIVPDKFRFEICQVETTIIVDRELVS